MKKTSLKILSVLLALALLVCAVPASVFAQNTQSGKIQFGVMTDLHYYAQANIDDKTKATEVCEKTMSTSHLSDAILMTALDFYKVQAEQGKIDYLLIPGDLTKDGDYVSHTTLASILENWEEQTGVPVLVTNGNHDINNYNAQTFENGKFVKAGWCGCRACEDKVKEETAATARVYAEGESAETCAVCGKKAEHVIVFARAY